MLEKGAVSVELAAKLAGMPLVEFVKLLRKLGIKPYRARLEDIDMPLHSSRKLTLVIDSSTIIVHP